MSYFIPDYTGEAPDHKINNDNYTLFKVGQKIIFPNGPVFLKNIKVKNASDVSIVYKNGTVWEATESDHDQTAMAKAISANSAFVDILVTSITIKSLEGNSRLNVLMDYQKLYPVAYKSSVGENGSVDLNPELLISMLERMSNLEASLGTSASKFISPTPVVIKLLKFDIHGTLSDNLIKDEIHLINTFTKYTLIRPSHGAFFKDSVTVKIKDTDVALVKNVDYTIVGVNRTHTKQTNNVSGVYNFIHILKEISDKVAINYHAVGGETTTVEMREIVDNLNNVNNYLGAKSFLTTESLANSNPLLFVKNNLTKLEERVRTLIIDKAPTYNDSTANDSYRRNLTSTDGKHHWYTIASLYKVDGSDDIFTSDRITFRIKLITSGLMADITVAFDSVTKNMVITSDNVLQKLGYELFGSTTTVPAQMPQFRVIWNKQATTEYSGALLQLGISHLGALSDVMGIEDRSGLASTWILDGTAGPVTPADDTVILPDKMSTWVSTSSTSFKVDAMMPIKERYCAIDGSFIMSSLDKNVAKQTLLSDEFNIASIKNIQLIFQHGNNYYPVIVNMLSKDNNSYGLVDLSTGNVNSTELSVIIKPNTTTNKPELYIGPTWNINNTPLASRHLRYVLIGV